MEIKELVQALAKLSASAQETQRGLFSVKVTE